MDILITKKRFTCFLKVTGGKRRAGYMNKSNGSVVDRNEVAL